MKKSNKSIVIGVFLVAVLLSIRLINNKREEVYELDSSNNLQKVESRGIAILYKDSEEGAYQETDNIPKGNYEVDTNESYCIKGESKDHINPTPNMEYKDNKVYIKVDSSGLKCIVYLKKVKEPTAEDTLDNLGIDIGQVKQGTLEITGPSCEENKNNCGGTIKNMKQNGIYVGEDDYGPTYYFRGVVDNNWVKFGKTKNEQDIYWRIIRINGNGTIRLIYSGSGAAQLTGSETQINGSTGVAFNTTNNDNKYVGYMYGNSSDSYANAHKNEVNSTILNEIVSWYNAVDGTQLQDNKTQNYSSTGFDASTYGKYIDGATGFCNDRQISDTARKWWSNEDSTLSNLGWGSHATAYAPFSRIMTTSAGWNSTQTPTFMCVNKERDLFTVSTEQSDGNGKLTVPVGLITADEVLLAGGFGGASNTSYWLYTGTYYWTMSPSTVNSNGLPHILIVNTTGILNYLNANNNVPGVRPVINLKAGTKFTIGGAGTSGEAGSSTNPYVVQLS